MDQASAMDITTLRELINRALADGKLTREEMDRILLAMNLDRKISGEEFKLVREIQEKIARKEITIVE
ncbi:MAG: hypothetical protein HC921_13570 [Synechococcaceae cyanobacterium SM2_3_1]|nr:hypothetical protein [Synechococcaceae cyanobacterium SM2_3_1]